MLKALLKLFLSLRTASWLLAGQLLLLIIGAFQMPAMKEYETLNSMPLMRWLAETSLVATWWLWGLIGLLALLALNTVSCGIDSLLRRRQGRKWLLIVSPQAVHAGFLFILLAHLLSSAGGLRGKVTMLEGSAVDLPNGTTLVLRDIEVSLSQRGYPTDWSAEVEYHAGGRKLGQDVLAPNKPSFFRGLGVYLKEVRPGAALIEISREPGAPWALAGGILFMAGTFALFAVKIGREK